MNFVYVCRDGDNEELRYSLRSLIKHTENPNIWVVGGKPSWYQGNYLKVEQRNTKHKNVINNLRTLSGSNEIPYDFILMNDDFYIVKPIDKIETYHGGFLQDKIDLFTDHMGPSAYSEMLQNTCNRLKAMGIENPIDYSIHVPMHFNKDKLSTTIKPKLSFRTMYGNIFQVGGEEIKDVKFHRKATRDWTNNPDLNSLEFPFLSSSDASFGEIYKSVLIDMFDTPSPFEKG